MEYYEINIYLPDIIYFEYALSLLSILGTIKLASFVKRIVGS